MWAEVMSSSPQHSHAEARGELARSTWSMASQHPWAEQASWVRQHTALWPAQGLPRQQTGSRSERMCLAAGRVQQLGTVSHLPLPCNLNLFKEQAEHMCPLKAGQGSCQLLLLQHVSAVVQLRNCCDGSSQCLTSPLPSHRQTGPARRNVEAKAVVWFGCARAARPPASIQEYRWSSYAGTVEWLTAELQGKVVLPIIKKHDSLLMKKPRVKPELISRFAFTRFPVLPCPS